MRGRDKGREEERREKIQKNHYNYTPTLHFVKFHVLDFTIKRPHKRKINNLGAKNNLKTRQLSLNSFQVISH